MPHQVVIAESTARDARGTRVLRRGLRRRKCAGVDEGLAESNKCGVVNRQHSDGGTASAGAADKTGTLPAEMPAPLLPARVKQRRQRARVRVDAGDVRPLGTIAKEAAERQVILGRAAAVLLGKDVIDRKGDRRMGLRKLAIFAAMVRAFADQADQRAIHGSMAAGMLLQGEHGFSPQQVELQADLTVIHQFIVLLGGEVAFLVSSR